MLDLDALVNPEKLPVVKVFGREHPVHPLTTAAAHKVAVAQGANDNGEAVLAALLDVVRLSVPTLSAEDRERLSVEQVSAIVQVTRGAVAEVEASLGERAEKN